MTYLGSFMSAGELFTHTLTNENSHKITVGILTIRDGTKPLSHRSVENECSTYTASRDQLALGGTWPRRPSSASPKATAQ